MYCKYKTVFLLFITYVQGTLYSMHANSDTFMSVFISWNRFTYMYVCVYECSIYFSISELTSSGEPWPAKPAQRS